MSESSDGLPHPPRRIRTFDDGTIVEVELKKARRIVWGPALSLDEISSFQEAVREAYRRKGIGIVRVRTHSGRRFEFDNKQHALIWANIWYMTGGTRFVTDRDLIPYNVAALGKAAIAAYLSTVHPMSMEEVADALDVSEQTVIQYRSDFVHDRR